MKHILFAILAVFCLPAFADSAALSGSVSGATALSGSLSEAQQRNVQNITVNGAAIPTNTYSQVDHTGTSTVKTAPQVYAPPVGVTAPCRISFAGGLSIVGVGVGGGGSVGDSPCNLRELSRLYHGIGQVPKAVAVADAALSLECQDEAVAKALGGLCPVQAGQLPAPVAVAPVAEPVKISKAPVCYETTDAMGIKTTRCPN